MCVIVPIIVVNPVTEKLRMADTVPSKYRFHYKVQVKKMLFIKL